MSITVSLLSEVVRGQSEVYPSPCSQIRLICLLRNLEERGLIKWYSQPIQTWTQGVDIVVMNRNPFVNPKELDLFLNWKSSNPTIPILYDIDDNLFDEAPRSHPEYDHLRRLSRVTAQCLLLADIITTSNAKLTFAISKLTSSSIVTIPNRVLTDKLRCLKRADLAGGVNKILFMGTNSHAKSISSLEALFATDSPNYCNLSLDVIGLDGRSSSWYTAIPYSSICPDDLIYSLGGLSGYLCGIAPLFGDKEFDSYKTDIKAYDYLYAGLPILASNTEPYTSSEQVRAGGILVGDSLEDWKAALAMAKDIAYMQKLSIAGYNAAKNSSKDIAYVSDILFGAIQQAISIKHLAS